MDVMETWRGSARDGAPACDRRADAGRMPSPSHRGRLAAMLLAAVVLAGCAAGPKPGPVVPAKIPPVPPPPLLAPPVADVVPMPLSVRMEPQDSFTVDTGTVIVVGRGQAEPARIGHFLARLIGTTRASTPPVLMSDSAPPPHAISLVLDTTATSLGEEGYELEVDTTAVRIVARRSAGLFYGVQTLRQLMPVAVEYTAARPRPMKVPAGHIVDVPRFAWRGMMLDVARHFLGVKDVERFIDLMALYKMNRLHLHLADDQGWRIEVPSWPNLARWGGLSAVGGGPGGFYTDAQWKKLVRYAQDNYVTIVPEIDMPGHITAALSAYGQLTCDGKPLPRFTGVGTGPGVLCMDRDVTYRFVSDVVRDIARITPGPYFHIGGDEVRGLTRAQYAGFIQRVQQIVHDNGKRMIGWSEIAPLDLPPSVIVQSWIPDSSSVAAARGSQIIVSQASHAYLDMKYDSTTVLGLGWAGHLDLKKVYDWLPAQSLPGVPESAILGVEAPMWSETLGTLADFEFMALPRLPAVAEVAWSAPERRSFESFRSRLAAHVARWTAMGLNHRDSPYLH